MTTALAFKLGRTHNVRPDGAGITCTHSRHRDNYRGQKFTTVVSLTTQFPAQASWPPAASSQQLLDLTNAHRVSIGLNALVFHPVLQGISDWKVRNCANYLYMDHDTPAETDWNFPARSINDRFADLQYPQNMAWGENLAYGFLVAQTVFDAWMSDIGHRQNIEQPDYTTCGMSSCHATKMDLVFWGQDFGSYHVVVPPVVDPYTNTEWRNKLKPFSIRIQRYSEVDSRVWFTRLDNHRTGSMLTPYLKKHYTQVAI